MGKQKAFPNADLDRDEESSEEEDVRKKGKEGGSPKKKGAKVDESEEDSEDESDEESESAMKSKKTRRTCDEGLEGEKDEGDEGDEGVMVEERMSLSEPGRLLPLWRAQRGGGRFFGFTRRPMHVFKVERLC